MTSRRSGESLVDRRSVLCAGAAWVAGSTMLAGGTPSRARAAQDEPLRTRRLWLRLLLEQVEKDARAGRGLTDEERYLVGLTRVKFLYVDEERRDLVLEGPAEDKWEVRPDGMAVGAASKQPLLQLDDFAVAWRNANDGSPPPSMSLESRQESVDRAQQYIRTTARPKTAPERAEYTRGMRQAWGPQDVVTAGVPQNTRFNKVMSDADWEMKRLSLGLGEPSIKEIPAYVDLEFDDLRRRVRADGVNAKKPDGRSRFWFFPADVEFLQSEKRDAVAIPEHPVQLLTETRYRTITQELGAAQEPTPAAKGFVDALTKHYATLAAANPLYAELRNLFDWVAIARLIKLLDVPRRTGLDLRYLLRGGYTVRELDVPTTMPGQVVVRHAEIQTAQGVAAVLFPARGGVTIDAERLLRSHQFRIAAELADRNGRALAAGPAPARFWR